MSAETDPGVDHLIDSTPAKKGTEVDLSGFHDVCRKILARPLPQGYKTGKFIDSIVPFLQDSYILSVRIFTRSRFTISFCRYPMSIQVLISSRTRSA